MKWEVPVSKRERLPKRVVTVIFGANVTARFGNLSRFETGTSHFATSMVLSWDAHLETHTHSPHRCLLGLHLHDGLEIYQLNQTNIKQIESCQKQTLRNILHLPASTATTALYLISGVAPVQARIERSSLMLFRNLIAYKNMKESHIIDRQLAVKSSNSRSWVVHIKELLTKYDLPSAYKLNLSPPKKSEWKLIVKKRVNEYWTKSLQEEASQKTTLRHLCADICTIRKLHHVWRKTPYNKMAVLQAGVRVKILVGRYTLQEDTNKYRGSDAPCPVCKVAPENLYHFLFVCTELSEVQEKYLKLIPEIVINSSCNTNWERIMKSQVSDTAIMLLLSLYALVPLVGYICWLSLKR